jgi:hypothetical protein
MRPTRLWVDKSKSRWLRAPATILICSARLRLENRFGLNASKGVVYPERRSAEYQPYSRETGDGVRGLEDQDQTNRDV